MDVRECMTADVEVVSPQMTLKEAAVRMRAVDFGSLPVGMSDEIMGMVTDRDMVVGAVAEGMNPNEAVVGDVMSKDLVCCYEDDRVESAAEMMAQHKIRRLPVLDAQDKLVGILSLGDISRARSEDAGESLTQISEDTSSTHLQ